MTSSLEQRVEEIFSQDGPLANATDNYKPRPSQVEFAKAVARALENNETLVVEAGTGTGKTFAYLVPALLHEGKVLISTAGKTLQDQLFYKDIPAVLKSLGIGVKVALLKGRANYICKHRLDSAIENNVSKSREEVGHLQRIKFFSKVSQTGERSELTDVPENSGIWPEVTSTAENCLSDQCSYCEECFVMKAREKAREADILVINHHLFLADLSLKDDQITDFLPEFDLVVLDEAHQIPSIADSFFSETLNLSDIKSWTKDAIIAGSGAVREEAGWGDWGKRVSNRCDDVVIKLAKLCQKDRVKMALTKFKDAPLLAPALKDLEEALGVFAENLREHKDKSPEIEMASERADGFCNSVRHWRELFEGTGPIQSNIPKVQWFTLTPRSVFFNETPLSIAESLEKSRQAQGKPWVLTSATLATDGDFSHFNEQLGLKDVQTYHWDSPFNYEEQALLYVPQNISEPSAFDFSEQVADTIWPFIKANKGRAFVLCTTMKALETISEDIKFRVEKEELDYPVLVQNEMPRAELLKRFRESGKAILVGSMSFWEGVDIKGDALSLVIIDKIPFAPPDDPIFEGKAKFLESQGRNSFTDLMLPEATMLLMQGAGRLIRDTTDRGMLMICDKRLISKSYGQKIWKSLPKFSRTARFDVAMEFVDPSARSEDIDL